MRKVGGGKRLKKIEKKIEVINVIMLAILIACTLIGNAGPFFSILLLLSIIPVVIIGVNSNWIFRVSAIVLAVAITFIVHGSEATLATVFIYILPAFLSAIIYTNEGFRDSKNRKIKLSFRQNNNVYSYASLRVFMIAIIIFALGIIGYYASMKIFMNVDIIKSMQSEIKDIVSNYNQLIKSSDLKAVEGSGVLDLVQNTGTIIMISVFTRAVISAVISYFFAIPILNKYCEKKIFNIKFDCIILPGNPVGVLFISIIVLFIIGLISPDIDTKIIINSFIFIMNILFFLEGTSLIVFIIRRWKGIRKNINWMLMIFLIVFMGILPGISVLGMLDNLWNYRLRWDPSLKNFGGKNE